MSDLYSVRVDIYLTGPAVLLRSRSRASTLFIVRTSLIYIYKNWDNLFTSVALLAEFLEDTREGTICKVFL